MTRRPHARHARRRRGTSPWWPLGIGALAFVVLFLVVLLVALVTDPSSDAVVTTTSLGPGPAPTTTASTAPPPTTTTADPAVPPTLPAAEVEVLVLNGAGVAGLAGRVTDDVTAAGFAALVPGNADPRSVTTLYVRSGLDAECEAVRQVVQPRFTADVPTAPIGDAPPAQGVELGVEAADCVLVLGDDVAVRD